VTLEISPAAFFRSCRHSARAHLKNLRSSYGSAGDKDDRVRRRRDLDGHRVAVTNQLRAHLQIVFPGAVGPFCDIDSCGSCLAHPAQAGLMASLVWATAVRSIPRVLHPRLTAAPCGATGPERVALKRLPSWVAIVDRARGTRPVTRNRQAA